MPPTWAADTPPTRSAAIARIARVRPDDYARTRNHLEGAVTGLSPYLTHGLITPREVVAALLAREPLQIDHKLVCEFGWREFYRHVWAHEGDGILHSLHEGPLPESAYARELPLDIREARTGIPVIDHAVRTLYTTGTLHNHARMWLASYVVHLRGIHWRAGADWLVAHLLDGDLASNHLSWQWVAGTGSTKPYLFNAENVARFAPAQWASPGTIIDRSYEELDRIARAPKAPPLPHTAQQDCPEPALHGSPPAALGVQGPEANLEHLRDREVWLVHPWALRAPPQDLAADAIVIGIYPREHHQAWPWPAARWDWVDTAMRALTPHRWWADAATLGHALQGAARVRSYDDPHISPWLKPLATLEPAGHIFPDVDARCRSFFQWWKHATRGLDNAVALH